MSPSQSMKLRFLAAFLVMAWVSPVLAQDADDNGATSNDFIHERTYVGALGVYGTIDKNQDFSGNGANSLFEFSPGSGEEEIDTIPSFNVGYGFGFLFGHREGVYAAELSYLQSYHTASFSGSVLGGPAISGQSPAIYHVINIDFKRYFLEKFPTQPFISLGLNYTWIDVDNASALIDTNSVPPSLLTTGNLSIEGIGFNLGAGLEIYLGSDISLVGGVYERFTGFMGMTGYAREERTPQSVSGKDFNLNSTGLNGTVGMTVSL